MIIEDYFWLAIMLIFLAAAMMFVKSMRCHRLRVRDPYDRARYVTDYLMEEKKDKKSGVIWWVSVPWQKRIKMPQPPNEVVDVGKKGKKYCEVYRQSDREFVFLRDQGLDPESKVMKGFKPFSTVQRQVIISQFAKAEENRNKNFFRENAINLTCVFAMMLIIIVGIIYWGDIAKYTLDKDKSSSGLIKEAQRLLIDAKSVSNDIVQGSTGGITSNGEDPPKK